MHELAYAVELVDTVEAFMKENHLSEVSSVTLQVGEATGIVPQYMFDCWPAAIDESEHLKGCKLVIDYLPAKGVCRNCNNEFVIVPNHGKCPKCGSEEYDINTGYEFEITEIRGR